MIRLGVSSWVLDHLLGCAYLLQFCSVEVGPAHPPPLLLELLIMVDTSSLEAQAHRLTSLKRALAAAAVDTPDPDMRRELQEAIVHVDRAFGWLSRTRLGDC
jgi:hypothetical protein